jgi:hypothetical protein
MGKPNLALVNWRSCPSTISPTPSVWRRRMCEIDPFAFDPRTFDIGKLGPALGMNSTAPFLFVMA